MFGNFFGNFFLKFILKCIFKLEVPNSANSGECSLSSALFRYSD